jgi:hypothetical protein
MGYVFSNCNQKKSSSVTLFVGGQTARIQREKVDLGGHRCFTAAYNRNYPETPLTIGLLDSALLKE